MSQIVEGRHPTGNAATRAACPHPLARVPALLLLGALAGGAGAADYPVKPIRLVIPFAPGGSNDIVGRMVGQQLQERVGQAVIIDNRGGAGGVIGTELVARAAPDGYTLLIVSVAFAFNPALYKLSYDSVKSFAPIAMVGSGPNVLVVNPQLPVNSVKELIAYARANPNKLNLASAGIGSFQHLSGELFTRMAKVQMTHVPFMGGGPAIVVVPACGCSTTDGLHALLLSFAFVLSRRRRCGPRPT